MVSPDELDQGVDMHHGKALQRRVASSADCFMQPLTAMQQPIFKSMAVYLRYVAVHLGLHMGTCDVCIFPGVNFFFGDPLVQDYKATQKMAQDRESASLPKPNPSPPRSALTASAVALEGRTPGMGSDKALEQQALLQVGDCVMLIDATKSPQFLPTLWVPNIYRLRRRVRQQQWRRQ